MGELEEAFDGAVNIRKGILGCRGRFINNLRVNLKFFENTYKDKRVDKDKYITYNIGYKNYMLGYIASKKGFKC